MAHDIFITLKKIRSHRGELRHIRGRIHGKLCDKCSKWTQHEARCAQALLLDFRHLLAEFKCGDKA